MPKFFIRNTFVAVAAFILFSAGAAKAQTEIDPAALKLAHEVLEVSRITSGFNVILPEMAERTKTLFIRSNPALTEEIVEATDKAALGMISKRVELQNSAAELWAKNFSAGELAVILKFYQTDAGAKFALNYGSIVRDTIQLTNDWGQNLAQELAAKVRIEMKLKGHTL